MRPSDPAVLPPLHSAPQIIIDMCERDALRRLRSLASEASRSRSPASVFNPGDVALLGAPVLIFSESRRASLPAATPSPRWWGSRSTSSICWCSRPERRLSLRWAKTAASRANEFPRRCSGACQWRWSGDSTCCTFFFIPLWTLCRLKLQRRRRRDSRPSERSVKYKWRLSPAAGLPSFSLISA